MKFDDSYMDSERFHLESFETSLIENVGKIFSFDHLDIENKFKLLFSSTELYLGLLPIFPVIRIMKELTRGEEIGGGHIVPTIRPDK